MSLIKHVALPPSFPPELNHAPLLVLLASARHVNFRRTERLGPDRGRDAAESGGMSETERLQYDWAT